MPSPLEIVQDVVIIARAIYDQAQKVESNKATWRNLNEVIAQITSSLQGLEHLPEKENFVRSLEKLQDQMYEINKFARQFCALPYWRRFALAGRHQSELNAYRQTLVELIPFLQLGLSAQSLIDRDKDRRAEFDDRAAFIEEQQRLLAQQQLSHQQERRDLEAVMKKQMDAFRAQLERNWQCQDEPVSPLPEVFLVKLYDIDFEEKMLSSRTGDVYQATWKAQPVLVKFIEGAISDTDRDQFIREAKLMSRLRHDSLVPFYGACFEETRMCLVTGRIESTLLDQLSRLTLEERYAISQELAEGLGYFHQQGVVHNDIHPQSVGITKRHAGRWIDLSWIKTELCSMASLGIAHDTTLWQAPETWRDRNAVSQASDVYSFGWLLWSLYTGRMPFPDERGPAFLTAIKEGRRETLPSDCPRHLSELIDACWLVDPNQRPTVTDIISVLEQPLHPSRAISPSGEAYYEAGKKAEQAGDLATAFENYEHAARKDCYKSYNSLGTFALGKGGQVKDPKKAEDYFQAGAKANHAPAMFNLARMHEKGDTKTQATDLSTALFWYKKASEADPKEPRYQNKVNILTETLRSSRK